MKNASKWLGILVAIVALGFSAASTEAANLTFDQVQNDGTVSYDGSGGALIGTDIQFETITGTGTDNDGTIDCAGCLLSFETGALISSDGTSYTFAAGGTLEIVGASVTAGIFVPTTLVSGTFTQPVTVTKIGTLALTVVGIGEDEKNVDLLSYFFNTPPEDFAFVQSEIQVGGGITNTGGADGFGFDAVLGNPNPLGPDFGNADFVNSTVPEPGTTTLLLLGLGGLAAYRRRQN